ncbi:hypothetical protein DFH94DRAFT_784617 [Russula ochroleuca]|uniref:Protein kinase domain-containing protein n=1 Tax=Russula ochroleuca TaxID=152965 RepID=A0A9P5MNF4_9AGAM|nr:hypothetical protein DFH94DRAFT_784617 [Russula ochroleuca]
MTVYPPAVFPQDDALPLNATNPGNAETATVTDVSDTPEDGASLQEIPKLETFIPGECLPDVIDVYIDKDFLYNTSSQYFAGKQFTMRQPIKLVRQYPPRTPADEGNVNGSKPSVEASDCDCPKGKVLTAQLDLRHTELLGVGHHSKVLLAPLTFPSTPSVRHAVAVKFSLPYSSHKMLLDEAKIYNAFPRDLQDGNTPIVPKFYGYYVRSTEVFDRDDGNNGGDNDLEKCWKSFQTVLLNSITSILLLEACGKPVNTDCLALSQRQDIGKLLKRLHKANFVQGSFYERNILIQPGPLTLPHAERSYTEPSYRIIDFGRGLGLHVNCSFLEDIRHVAKEERSDAHSRLLIN